MSLISVTYFTCCKVLNSGRYSLLTYISVSIRERRLFSNISETWTYIMYWFIYKCRNVNSCITVLLLKGFRWHPKVLSGFLAHIDYQLAAHNRDVGVCQVVSRSDCCVWRGCALGAWKASFLLLAGTRRMCAVEPCPCRNILILELIGITWAPHGTALSPIPVRLSGRDVSPGFFSHYRTSYYTHTSCHNLALPSLRHWITESTVQHSLTHVWWMVKTKTHTHTHSMTWSPHLHCLALSLPTANPPTSPGLISTSDGRDGRMEGVGVERVLGGDWNLRGIVSSLLTGSICKTFPTLLPDTDDSPKHHHHR